MSKTVSVKWTKHTYEITELPATLVEFKEHIQSLTSVPTDRQKLVCKGKPIDDDVKYTSLPDKSILMMIGSATTIQVTEAKKINNVNNEVLLTLPPGLVNLGNTCWLNSSLKALYAVPELRTALITYAKEHSNNIHTNHICQHNQSTSTIQQPKMEELNLILAIGNLYNDIEQQIIEDKTSEDEPIKPLALIMTIAQCYPTLFDLQAQRHEQQDADEFLTLFMTTLDKIFITTDPITKKQKHLIHDLFFVDIEVITSPKVIPTTISTDKKDDTTMGDNDTTTTTTTMGNDDDNDNEIVIAYDQWTKLRSDVNVDLSDIQGGIKNALTELIEKKSPLTQISMQYERKNLIVTLPKYLIVQLQRFQWKKETQSRAKLIRKVNINQQLDLYSLCTEKTQKEIEPYRKTMDALRTETLSAMNDGEKVNDNKGKIAGYYDLLSIVTHQGRSADSGHYVAWTKTGNNTYNEKSLTGMSEKEKERLKELQNSKSWIKHDDEKSTFTSDKILFDLAGGGDFHMAYICIYKAKMD